MINEELACRSHRITRSTNTFTRVHRLATTETHAHAHTHSLRQTDRQTNTRTYTDKKPTSHRQYEEIKGKKEKRIRHIVSTILERSRVSPSTSIASIASIASIGASMCSQKDSSASPASRITKNGKVGILN